MSAESGVTVRQYAYDGGRVFVATDEACPDVWGAGPTEADARDDLKRAVEFWHKAAAEFREAET